MKVSVVYALPTEQVWLPVTVDEQATVRMQHAHS